MNEEKKEKQQKKIPGLSSQLKRYPAKLWAALKCLSEKRGIHLYLVGGTVRDFFLEREPVDIDLTVEHGATVCCHILIEELGGGTFVPLGCRREDAARVVWRGLSIDFSSFRKDSLSIEEDLRLRDFTINCMAVDLSPCFTGHDEYVLIDPLAGADDLEHKILRSCPGAFKDDPLRLLRGYRLEASLGLSLEESTREEIIKHALLINNVSAERISYELDSIMNSGKSYLVVREMVESTLLFQIFPELYKGVGVEQPGFHHLDVFHHSLEALKHIEKIINSPAEYYPESAQFLSDYLQRDGVKGCLKWAALFHDLGKPATMAVNHEKGGRITFYEHDLVGSSLFEQISERLKWGNREKKMVSNLITIHMHPFHLCNVMRKQKLSKRSCLKICKRAGDDLAGLFILAMADSLAGKGEQKPEGMENELAGLLTYVLKVYDEDIHPALSGPKLLTGHDLIERFHLTPGPLFSTILDELEVARIEGNVGSRGEAMDWVRDYLRENRLR